MKHEKVTTGEAIASFRASQRDAVLTQLPMFRCSGSSVRLAAGEESAACSVRGMVLGAELSTAECEIA
jgi:hypothetical protein